MSHPDDAGASRAFLQCHADILHHCERLAAGGTDAVRAVAFMDHEMGPHHRDEEALLFPRLRALPLPAGDRAALHALLDALAADHEMLECMWRALRARVLEGSADARFEGDIATFVACCRQHLKREEAGILPVMKHYLGVAPLAAIEAGRRGEG